MEFYFTLIGTRALTDVGRERIGVISKLISELSELASVECRSGWAPGADSAWGEELHGRNLDISFYGIIPWNGFSDMYRGDDGVVVLDDLSGLVAADIIFRKVVPYYEKLKQSVRKLHTRNLYQVYGLSLSRSSDAVFYVPNIVNGKRKPGGTDVTLLYAGLLSIPSYNLLSDEDYENAQAYLKRAIEEF